MLNLSAIIIYIKQGDYYNVNVILFGQTHKSQASSQGNGLSDKDCCHVLDQG